MNRHAIPHSIFRLALTLLIITSLVALALAGVNAITKDRIAAIQERKVQEAMEEVLPGAQLAAADFTDETGTVRSAYRSLSGSPVQGYVVEVAPAGFGGIITVMVGIQEGKVSGISVVSHTETAGLGSVAAEKTAKGEAFRSQFVDLSGSLAVDKDGGIIDSITGATITSRAVTAGINAALACKVGDFLYG